MARRRFQGVAVAQLLVAVVLLAGCDWSQFRYGPEHTGFNPFETTISPANVSGLQRRWSQREGNLQALYTPPAIANGVLYARSDKLYAFDAVIGSARWSSAISTGYGSPTVANGVVYVSGNKVYAFNAATGAPLWSSRVTTGYGSPTVANGLVYVTGDKVYALNAMTGVPVWSSTVTAGLDSPAVANGVVYVSGDKLYALDAKTGAKLWSVPVAGATGSPAVGSGAVYLSSWNGLYTFNAKTGHQLWTAPAAAANSSPAVANGVAYVSGNDLYALNATTGAKIWSATTHFAGSPTVANGVVFVGAAELYALNAATGAYLWSAKENAENLVIANGVLYGTGSGLYAYGLPIAAPQLVVSPAFPDDSVFGDPSSGARTFTITNAGPIPTSIITASLSGPDATTFRVDSDGCAGVSLAGGASCMVTVSFTPTRSGSRIAWLTATAAVGGTAKALLAGTAQPFTLTPSRMAFADVVVGSTSTAVFTLSNLSSGPVGPIVTSITAGSAFTVAVDACVGKTIAAGSSCTISVLFAPTSTVDYSATLVADAPGLRAEAVILGRGISRLAIDPSYWEFESVRVGEATSATFTVTNISPYSVGPIATAIQTVWGVSAFSIASDTCAGRTLSAHSSCAVAVAFKPSSRNGFAAYLTTTASLSDSATATLVGAGV